MLSLEHRSRSSHSAPFLPGEVALPSAAAAGPGRPAHLVLTYQLCDDRRCLPPATRTLPLS